ncbi:hypothetical protein P8C59_009562 [Phyllachora maydis]|uniref:Uncharacterized protein n=1 Tax=Phyllachora maydis TaxID=1825666 RepID=A0AAD9IDK6_9PEZI|nr:hypothetical protein P8C59_009562 [Phyllachora maydis]
MNADVKGFAMDPVDVHTPRRIPPHKAHVTQRRLEDHRDVLQSPEGGNAAASHVKADQATQAEKLKMIEDALKLQLALGRAA